MVIEGGGGRIDTHGLLLDMREFLPDMCGFSIDMLGFLPVFLSAAFFPLSVASQHSHYLPDSNTPPLPPIQKTHTNKVWVLKTSIKNLNIVKRAELLLHLDRYNLVHLSHGRKLQLSTHLEVYLVKIVQCVPCVLCGLQCIVLLSSSIL